MSSCGCRILCKIGHMRIVCHGYCAWQSRRLKPRRINGNSTALFCSRTNSAYIQYTTTYRRPIVICECLYAGSEAPLEPSTSQLTSYAVRLSPTNTHSSSQLSPRNSGASQQWGGEIESAQNQPWQAGEGNLSSSPAKGSSRANMPRIGQ